ncbi:kelch domain-containing protein 9 isoform X1 [Myotis daubentonii]|uniref:kelch domain-containing protein 9 isoform X1 n=1 Tax=Myotis daubentonii TaxID=98922 RepID=UPI002873E58D|nr:kelch domain-containing protein 9 isoform X1 [Myotis daubentonii]
MAVAPPGGAGGSRWTWRPVARDALLARAFHSCTELRGRLYLVGGLLAGGAAEPSADTVVLDLAGAPAVRVGARGGPRRSHHDAAALGGRWLCAVGGWDGARRLAAVAALDAERGEWEAWTAAPGSCPPAGLSSHTCTRLSDRELRVAGREGGTRTQRRYGSIYTLRLDPGARTYWPPPTFGKGGGEKAGQLLVSRNPDSLAHLAHILSYREESCRSASRSGHCAALLPTPGPRPGHQLLLFGGCDSAEPEVAGHWGHGKIQEAPAAPRLTEQLAKLVSSGQGSRQGPRGLRHHSCSVVGPFAVLFGGETLTRARDTICNDLYVYDTRRAPSLWFHFPCADRALKRVGHRTCLCNDQLYLVGGFGEDGRTASPQVCTLDLFL